MGAYDTMRRIAWLGMALGFVGSLLPAGEASTSTLTNAEGKADTLPEAPAEWVDALMARGHPTLESARSWAAFIYALRREEERERTENRAGIEAFARRFPAFDAIARALDDPLPDEFPLDDEIRTCLRAGGPLLDLSAHGVKAWCAEINFLYRSAYRARWQKTYDDRVDAGLRDAGHDPATVSAAFRETFAQQDTFKEIRDKLRCAPLEYRVNPEEAATRLNRAVRRFLFEEAIRASGRTADTPADYPEARRLRERWERDFPQAAALVLDTPRAIHGEDKADSLPRRRPLSVSEFRRHSDDGLPAPSPAPFRVDGSTSAQPLVVGLAACFFGERWRWVASPEWTEFGPFLEAALGTRPSGDRSTDSSPVPAPRPPRLNQTHTAYNRLIDGRTDMILVARLPSEDERKRMAEKNVELDPRPVARDAFIFLVNRTNPVRSLTRAQLVRAYTEAKPNWNLFGGPDLRLDAFTRNRNSGSQELFHQLVLEGRPLPGDESPFGKNALIVSSMLGIYNLLHGELANGERRYMDNGLFVTPWRNREPGRGVGFSLGYYERLMVVDPQTRPLAVDGVMPTPQHIEDGTYPYIYPVYLVTRADLPADHPAAVFRDWVASPEGQRAVAETGYAPFTGNR